MESKEMDKKIVSQMAEVIYSNLSCVVYANNNTQSYTLIKGDEFWENSLGKEGKLSKLFYQLFTKRNNDATTENTRYKDFVYVEFFKKESYCGNIEVSSKEKKNEVWGVSDEVVRGCCCTVFESGGWRM